MSLDDLSALLHQRALSRPRVSKTLGVSRVELGAGRVQDHGRAV